MIDLPQLKLALRLRNVSRFQTHRLQVNQKVDQHSFRATAIYSYLGGKELEAMLFHDLEESVTGDLPTPVKKEIQGLEKFEALRPQFEDAQEKKLGKLADLLELVIDLREQLLEVGRLPPALMEIYEAELDRAKDLAKGLNKTSEVNKLLREIGK